MVARHSGRVCPLKAVEENGGKPTPTNKKKRFPVLTKQCVDSFPTHGNGLQGRTGEGRRRKAKCCQKERSNDESKVAPGPSTAQRKKGKKKPRRAENKCFGMFGFVLERNSRDAFGGINLCIVEGKSFEECFASAIGTIFRLPHAPIMVGTNRALAGLLAGKQIVLRFATNRVEAA